LDFLKGRTNRATYWLGLGIGFGVLALIRIIMRDASINEVLLLILAIPRLHDIGRSGWWVLASLGLTFGAAALCLAFIPAEDIGLALGAVVLGLLALLAWLGVVPGQADENRFGPRPRSGVDFRRHPAR
jgi:uncharacterized membrane protein YhaH (DUF805 family)